MHVRAESDVSALDMTGGSEGMTYVFLKLTARSDKEKTSVEHQPQRCKETKVYEHS